MSDVAAPPSDLLSLSSAASELGIHKETLARNFRAGMFHNYGTVTRPLVSLADVRAARATERDPVRLEALADDDGALPLFSDDDEAPASAAAPAQREGGPGLLDLRRANLAFEIRRKTREEAVALGELLDKGEVADVFFELARGVRDGLEAMALDMTARFGVDTGAAVREAGRRLCADLAAKFQAMADDARNAA